MFGGYIADIRRKKNLSQIELSRLLSVSASYLNQIENGKKPVNRHFVEIFCHIVGLPQDDRALLVKAWQRSQEEYVLNLGDNPTQQKIRLARKLVSKISKLRPAHLKALDAVLDTTDGLSA